MRHSGIAQWKARFHQLRVFLTCVADRCQLIFDVQLLWNLRNWLREQPSNDDFGANRQFREALPRNSHCLVTVCFNSSDPTIEIVPDVEEHPTVPDRTESLKMEEHPVVPERTEPWRPLTENENYCVECTLSRREKSVRRSGSQIASRTWALRHQEHGGQSASKSCSSNSAGGRQTHVLHGLPGECQIGISSCNQWKGHGNLEQSWQMDIFYWKHPLKEVACQRHVVIGRLFKGGCDSDLANCTSSGTSWKCVSIGSKTNATRIVVQVLRTSRDSHDRP